MPFFTRPDHLGLIRPELLLDLDPVVDERGIEADAVAQQSVGLGANSGPGTRRLRPLAARPTNPFEEVGGRAVVGRLRRQRPDPARIT